MDKSNIGIYTWGVFIGMLSIWLKWGGLKNLIPRLIMALIIVMMVIMFIISLFVPVTLIDNRYVTPPGELSFLIPLPPRDL